MNAKEADNFFSRTGTTIYHGAINDEGIILYLVIDEDVAHRWAKEMATTDFARSDDGLAWAFT